MNWFAPGPSSLLAAASTAHLALALIRKHQASTSVRGWLLALVSAGFAATPWIWASPRDLVIGGAAHLVWFVASGKLAGERRAGSTRGLVLVPRPAASPTRTAAPATATTPLPEPRKPAGPVQTPVLAVFDETPEIRTIRMARPEGFEFQAGQFLTVQIQLDGRPATRCYSISSCPDARGYLEISVKRQGRVSGTLHSTVRPGSLLAIRPPAGSFVYPAGDDRPIVLVSGGVGCTPMMSMLRHAASREPARPVYYLHSAKTESDIAFRQELALLARRHPQVRIVTALTRASTAGEHYPGRIDANLLQEVVPSPAESLFYVCGPASMISGVKDTLARMGVPAAQVRSEAFEAAVAASRPSVVTAPAPAPAAVPAAATRPELVAVRRAAPAGAVTLRLARSGKTAPVARDQSLLEAAESAEVEIPNLCRAGTCGTCRTRLLSGDVECTADVMDDEDRRGGYVFPCVAWARSDCALEA